MRPVVATVGPLAAASANNIAVSQTTGAAHTLILNGSSSVNGVGILDKPRRILITTASSTQTFTVTGTTPTGSVITENLTVPSGSAFTAQDFATVTSVFISGATTGAVQVGTNGIASTPWVRTDEWADAAVSIQCNATGTVNYTVQVSNDDPNSPTNPVLPSAMTWIPSNDTNAVGATASILTNYLFSPAFIRVLLNSGTGSVAATVTQYNVANR